MSEALRINDDEEIAELRADVESWEREWNRLFLDYQTERLERNKVTDRLNWWFLFALALLYPYSIWGSYLIGHFLGTLLGV
jgi:hypothetical protein